MYWMLEKITSEEFSDKINERLDFFAAKRINLDYDEPYMIGGRDFERLLAKTLFEIIVFGLSIFASGSILLD